MLAKTRFEKGHTYKMLKLTLTPDILWTFGNSAYNTIFKLLFLASSAYTVYLMVAEYKPTNDPKLDTFKVQYLVGGAAAMALIFPPQYTPFEVSTIPTLACLLPPSSCEPRSTLPVCVGSPMLCCRQACTLSSRCVVDIPCYGLKSLFLLPPRSSELPWRHPLLLLGLVSCWPVPQALLCPRRFCGIFFLLVMRSMFLRSVRHHMQLCPTCCPD